jgi:hypothetical protein
LAEVRNLWKPDQIRPITKTLRSINIEQVSTVNNTVQKYLAIKGDRVADTNKMNYVILHVTRATN